MCRLMGNSGGPFMYEPLSLTESAITGGVTAAGIGALYAAYRGVRAVAAMPLPWWGMAAVLCLPVAVFGWHQALSQQSAWVDKPPPPTISESNPPHVVEARMKQWSAEVELYHSRKASVPELTGVIPTYAAWPIGFTGLFAFGFAFVRSWYDWANDDAA